MPSSHPDIAVRHFSPAKRSGPAVLLLHGFLTSGEQDWPHARWVQPLIDRGREVLVADLPGHGQSRHVASVEQGRTGSIVGALAAALRSLSEPYDVVGYSLGARIAWSLAAQQPKRVRKIALGGLAPYDPFARLDLAAARQMVDSGIEPADQTTAFVTNMIVSSGQDAHALLDFVEGLAAEPFEPGREAPWIPALFLAGLEDTMAGNIAELEPYIPGSRTVRVPGDHRGALSSDAFRTHVLEFVG